MQLISSVEEAWQRLRQSEIIAYPTESVYGLGCDPFNPQAVEKLFQLKKRSALKGLILLIAEWEQLFPLIKQSSDILFDDIRKTWPGPVTWIFPKSEIVPELISQEQDGTIAIRMTAHLVSKQLAKVSPLISTSANIAGQNPARSIYELEQQFPQGIDAVVAGDLGNESKPSAIYHACTGERFR